MEYKINVKNVHLAEVTEGLEGTLTFGKPEHVAGAMEMGRTPQLSTGQLYGDGKISHKNAKKVAYQITANLNKLPTKWRRYIEGVTVTKGVESGTSEDEPKPFAIGWEVEKTGGQKELIWFLYCVAEPIQQTEKQSEDSTNYSTDSVTITALENDSLGRYYTMIDSEDEDITEQMVKAFFTQVQTTDMISPSTIDLAVIPGVVAPVTGASPVTTAIDTAQYTGTIAWSPVADPFAASTVYTATITLTPKAGYVLTGVTENFFTVTGATATNSADSGVVTAVFPETAE